jgi:ribosome-interacting GTPase 1
MVNYGKGKIYKIEPIVEYEDGDIYIGSTTKDYLSQRMEKHRSSYKLFKEGKIKTKCMSSKLFDKYGIDNCIIILIESVNAQSIEELKRRERHYITTLKCINKQIPSRTKKEYDSDNRAKLSEYSNKYYHENKQVINQQVACDCGDYFSKSHRSRHMKSARHQQNIMLKQTQ